MGIDGIEDPVMIVDPYCGRCNRHESAVVMPSAAARCMKNMLKHLKANVCCKDCGDVMSLEMTE